MNFSEEDLHLIDLALREDIGSGDITSEYFVGENDQASARAIAKERAIVAGTEVAAEVFRRVDPELRARDRAKGWRHRSRRNGCPRGARTGSLDPHR